MGLDMYLNKKIWIGEQYEHRGVKTEVKVTKNDGSSVVLDEKISEIVVQAIYWRKANQIHNWFVKNVQGGEDNCEPHEVSIDQLKQLLDLCTEIMLKKTISEKTEVAKEKLPTSVGLFFGGTEYDKYYYEDIKYTMEELEKLLAKVKKDEEAGLDVSFEYESSW